MSKAVHKKSYSSRRDPGKALKHLFKAQEWADRVGGPTQGMTEDAIISSIKRKRNARWEARFASRT